MNKCLSDKAYGLAIIKGDVSGLFTNTRTQWTDNEGEILILLSAQRTTLSSLCRQQVRIFVYKTRTESL